MSLHDDRKEYQFDQLDDGAKSLNPMVLFKEWLESYRQTGAADATAFALSTVGEDGLPDARIVLLKDVMDGALVFYTHYTSKKGRDLAHRPKAHALFFWREMERQIRISGSVIKVSEEKSDAYFHSRPPGSQRGAMASNQSEAVSSRAEMETKFQALAEVPDEALHRPAGWGGYALQIERIEFWQGRPSRMHDRIAFTLKDHRWDAQRLEP
ncbi:pyridoxamine 5'-phosphate oxidase [Schleiferiaceae bacterium]|jgi:pyridoxamine 5'-phosphate oxidase|nr:pyridoxamine 5'-phosphate oxidase [Schleiferiaceae bacterium]